MRVDLTPFKMSSFFWATVNTRLLPTPQPSAPLGDWLSEATFLFRLKKAILRALGVRLDCCCSHPFCGEHGTFLEPCPSCPGRDVSEGLVVYRTSEIPSRDAW